MYILNNDKSGTIYILWLYFNVLYKLEKKTYVYCDGYYVSIES